MEEKTVPEQAFELLQGYIENTAKQANLLTGEALGIMKSHIHEVSEVGADILFSDMEKKSDVNYLFMMMKRIGEYQFVAEQKARLGL